MASEFIAERLQHLDNPSAPLHLRDDRTTAMIRAWRHARLEELRCMEETRECVYFDAKGKPSICDESKLQRLNEGIEAARARCALIEDIAAKLEELAGPHYLSLRGKQVRYAEGAMGDQSRILTNRINALKKYQKYRNLTPPELLKTPEAKELIKKYDAEKKKLEAALGKAKGAYDDFLNVLVEGGF